MRQEAYRAWDGSFDRDVAVKIVPPSWKRNLGALARLHREVRAITALSHPNVLAPHSGEGQIRPVSLDESEDEGV